MLGTAGGTGVIVAVLVWAAGQPWRLRRSVEVGSRTTTRDDTRVGARETPTVEVAVLLDLLGAALSSGVGIPRALDAVGLAVQGVDGASLRRVGAALLLGADWDAAWLGSPPRLGLIASALRPAWVHGAAPKDALRVAGAQVLRSARSRARLAAARLGVHLVLPLGLCLLPAFVLIGIVPVLVALGAHVVG